MNTNDILSLSSMLSKPEPEIKGKSQKSEFNPGSIGSKQVLPPKEIPKVRDPLTAQRLSRFCRSSFIGGFENNRHARGTTLDCSIWSLVDTH